MRKEQKYFTPARIAQYIITACMFIAGFIILKDLPDQVPVHWSFAGEPDNWMEKNTGTFLLPLITLGMVILFPILQKIDPKRKNYEKFRGPWEVIQISIVSMFAYFYAVTMYMTLNPQQSNTMGQFMFFGVGLLFVILGNLMGKVRHNYFVGLRTPWTLADPQVWQKSHRFTGWIFVIAGLAFIVESIIFIQIPYIFFSIIVLTVVIPIVYSYLISPKD
jgi:uncharacterized membrane protein